MTMVSSASSSQAVSSPPHLSWFPPVHAVNTNTALSANSVLPILNHSDRPLTRSSPAKMDFTTLPGPSHPSSVDDSDVSLKLLASTTNNNKPDGIPRENEGASSVESASSTSRLLLTTEANAAATSAMPSVGQSSSESSTQRAMPSSSGMLCVATETLRGAAGPSSHRQQSHKLQYRRLSASPSPCLSRRSSHQSTLSLRERPGEPIIATEEPQYRLPRKLPQPNIVVLSDPYKNLPGHLRRHGLFAEAQAFAEAGMPANYVLHAFMTTADGGPPALLAQSSTLLVKHKEEVARQMEKSKLDHTAQNAASALPESLTFDVESMDPQVEAKGLTPTHIAALHSSMPGKGSVTPSSRNGMLLPIHALPYVLQCVSLPALPTTTSSQASSTTGIREIPIVAFRVPNPQAFPITHRFIYTHDTTELLCTLLPIRYMTSTLNRGSSPIDMLPSIHISSESNAHPQQPPAEVFPSTTVPLLPKHFTVTRAVHALSQLPISELIGYARQVHAAWANGIAIGLLSHLYWSTLDRAWDVLMGAMTLKRGRQVIEDEMARTLLRERGQTPDTGLVAEGKRRRSSSSSSSSSSSGGGGGHHHHRPHQQRGVGDHSPPLPEQEAGSKRGVGDHSPPLPEQEAGSKQPRKSPRNLLPTSRG